MNVVVGFDAIPERALVGGKFAGLQAVARLLPVPPAVCVTTAAFAAAVDDRTRAVVTSFFEDARATIGSFLVEAMEGFQAELGDVALPDAVATELRVALAGRAGSRFAVRSSAVGEDGAASSAAGVYESFLDVDLADVPAAVAACWRSYYAPRAVTARVRAGDWSPEPRMAVVVQDMVAARLAGVAFTEGPTDGGLEIEWCEGTADGLVSGRVAPRCHLGPDGPPPLDAVARLAATAAEAMGRPVDMEWAWDGESVHVVQVRPVTARRRTTATGPHLAMARLYGDDLPAGLDLGEVRDVYAEYTAKRRPAYQQAARHAIATGPGVVACFDAPGLGERGNEVLAALGEADEVVVDLGGAVRQVVLPATALLAYLASICAGTSDRHTAIVRRFVRGETGAITRMAGPDELLVETSTDGLLAMNRGTARCDGFIVAVDGPHDSTPLVPSALADMARFTRWMHEWRPGIQLEWSCEAGLAWFVDFSVASADAGVEAARLGTCMAPGSASGPLLVLDDDDLLERLSIAPGVSIGKQVDVGEHRGLRAVVQRVREAERPIVRARRPYAVLSLLFDDVAGFVFESGSQLCHLAILLREVGLPAAVAAELPHVAEGDEILLVDGDVYAVAVGAAS